MKFAIFKRCKKTGRIIGIDMKSAWCWVFLPITGFLALAWFLLRVVPKPSRISYPCQRAAFPLAVGFLSFLFGITGIKTICKIIKSKKSAGSAAFGIMCAAVLCFFAYFASPLFFSGCGDSADAENIVATLPISEPSDDISADASEIPEDFENSPEAPYSVPAGGIGIFPGRVVYMHNPEAVKYEENGYWWEDECTIPEEVEKMLTESLIELTGQESAAKAWEALFRDFNGGDNYAKGEKIVIKLNLNLDDNGKNNRQVPSPQLVEALVSQLVNAVGADPGDITVTDPSRNIGDAIYKRISENADAALRNVRFVARNQIAPVPDKTAPLHFADGQTGYVSADYTAAKYLINLAVFRPHYMFGITLCGKNHFGSIYFEGDDIFSPVNMHSSWDRGYGEYSHITDLIAFEHLGKKTLLYMIDALYFAWHNEDTDVRRMATFGGKYPASLFLSQDPCAIDSVAYDYIIAENKQNKDLRSEMPANAPDNYLIEASYAERPPSNTDYDPNQNGVRASLGAFEHWNDDENKQYSRNLGKDCGIELIRKTLD
ncbi:MAG: DUF362 domain-containing protein [Oscillospiraceae bacterium]|nr:DUF362 domain-containing protein [Oscillospiraceae bacterium]